MHGVLTSGGGVRFSEGGGGGTQRRGGEWRRREGEGERGLFGQEGQDWGTLGLFWTGCQDGQDVRMDRIYRMGAVLG
jgi:hypothetical protein